MIEKRLQVKLGLTDTDDEVRVRSFVGVCAIAPYIVDGAADFDSRVGVADDKCVAAQHGWNPICYCANSDMAVLDSLAHARAATASGAPRYTADHLLTKVILPAYAELLEFDNLSEPLGIEATRGLFHMWSEGYHGAVRAQAQRTKACAFAMHANSQPMLN